MQIIPFTPTHSETNNNISAFINHWKPLVKLLPNVASFESYNWDMREVGSIESISFGNNKYGLIFTKLTRYRKWSKTCPLSQPLQDIAKAFALQHILESRPKSLTVAKYHINIWRYLEDQLLKRGLAASTEFIHPDLLDEVNLNIRKSGRAISTSYSLCRVLNCMVEDLQEAGLIGSRFTWKGVTVPPHPGMSRFDTKSENARKERLASDREMQAVGYTFHKAVLPRHRYPTAIAAILSAQPGRIGEVLALPVDCAFDDERNGKRIFRLRWRPEKGGKPMTKDFSYATNPWIPHIKTALAWLTEISEPARKIAKWYEDNPTKIHLPNHLEHLRNKHYLSLEEASAILQIKKPLESRDEKIFRDRNIEVHGKLDEGRSYRPENRFVCFNDIERSVLSELPKGFPIYQKSSGLKYSDTLCLFREWEFSTKNRIDSNPSHTLFKVPTRTQVQNLLDSTFEDFKCTNEDGQPIRINTHNFRHRWCTRAEEAGIWRAFNNAMSGRLKISQTNAYDHVTADKILEIVADNIDDKGCIFGEIITIIPNKPMYLHEIEQQINELAMLKAIVVTQFGICINDFIQSPCEYHLDCLACRNHACIKGLPLRTENIKKRLALQEKALIGANIALSNGDYGVEDHIKKTLEPNVNRLRAIVAILEDPRFGLGTEILLAGGPSNHPITKALKNRINGLKTKNISTNTEELALIPTWKAINPTLTPNE